jgi:hypothetical protein
MKEFTKEDLQKAFEDARKGKYETYYTEFDRSGEAWRQAYYNFDDWFKKNYKNNVLITKEMDEKLMKYFENGINIDNNEDGTFDVFTPATQFFKVNSLTELTPERFELEIANEKKHQDLEIKIFESLGSRI